MIVFIQNDPEVPAGIFAEELSVCAVPFHVVEMFDNAAPPRLEDTGAVIVLGGSMGVHDTAKYPYLSRVKDYILKVLGRGKPYLGICLGGQLLADVLGAPVSSGLHREIGTHSITLTGDGIGDPLFRSLPGRLVTFQWHNDSFAIPGGAVRMAYSAACPNQAFRYGEKAYGLQFHPEVNERIVAAWCDGFECPGTEPRDVMAGFRQYRDEYRSFSLGLLHNFLRIARNSR